MMRWFSHYWHGYLRIRFSGLSPERFFNLCSANHIEIWKLQSIQDSYEGFMTVADYRKCRPLVRKARVRLRILNRLGLPFFLQKNKKRKSFFSVFCFFSFFYTAVRCLSGISALKEITAIPMICCCTISTSWIFNTG